MTETSEVRELEFIPSTPHCLAFSLSLLREGGRQGGAGVRVKLKGRQTVLRAALQLTCWEGYLNCALGSLLVKWD